MEFAVTGVALNAAIVLEARISPADQKRPWGICFGTCQIIKFPRRLTMSPRTREVSILTPRSCIPLSPPEATVLARTPVPLHV
jgi:hypothetical protein